LLIVISLVVSYIAVQKNKSVKIPVISSQSLSQSATNQINGNETDVGGTDQTLNIQSNAVFSGNTLFKNDIDVAGSIKVSGALSLPGINVSGTSTLGQVNANSITASGNETVKGQLVVNQGLTVNGSSTFNGPVNASSITASTITINGDTTFSHHIYTNGSIPRVSTSGSLGSGGTASVNGSDTSGIVNMNSGSGAGSGCLATLTFAQAYSTAPFVEITPVTAAGGNSGYYVTRTTTGFSICADSPPSNSSLSFDYFVTG
jgi:cytoskeletal protein CcmA (bactofilin family)